MVGVPVQPVLFTPAGAGGRPATAVLAGGGSTVLGGCAYDEELVVGPAGVAWTAGGVLRKQFSTSGAVRKAAWCRFQNTGPDCILCLLQDAALAVHTQDGDAHLIPLPGRFTGMWPLPQGVLLTGAEGQGPCILVHPLENIQRVGVAGGGGSWGEREEVVWSSLEVPFLATFNPAQQRVAVWSVSTQRAQGFVAVTPMQWPGTPKTPTAQGAVGQAHTPLSACGALGSATGGYKKPSLRLPNGSLSPLAFQPNPRHGTPAAPAASTAGPGVDGALLLPSQEVPIFFNLLWEQRVEPGGQPDEGHLVTDECGGLLLCLLCKGVLRFGPRQVTVLRLPTSAVQGSVEVAFTLPATAVAAVAATFRGSQLAAAQPGPTGALPVRDLLVLHPDGRLGLFVGAQRVCDLTLPGPSNSGSSGGGSPVSGSSPLGPYARLLGAAAPVEAAQVQVARRDSSQLSTLHLPGSAVPVPFASIFPETESDEEMATASPSPAPGAATPGGTLPSVGSLADALREPLEPLDLKDAVGNRVTLVGRDGAALRVSLPFAPSSQLAIAALDALRCVLPPEVWWKLYVQWLATPGSTTGDGDREWAALSEMVLRWAADPDALHAQPVPHISAATTSSGPSASAGLLSPTGGSTPHSTPAGGRAWEELLGSARHKTLLASTRFRWAAAAPAPDANALPGQAAQQADGKEHVWLAFQALHSVYEDFKMSVPSWHLLLPLGATLSELAAALGAAAYQDHYARDLGTRSPPAPAAGAAQQRGLAGQAAPPDMFKALHALLRGDRDGGFVPALAQHRAAPVQRSVDLLTCYSILADTVAAASAPGAQDPDQLRGVLEGGARRLVSELVARHWTLAALDSLPYGVALPLRQALHQCRSNPPGGWPREAYVLIGRNDIAASMAASQEHDKPEAVGSAIVSTPLGKMAKAASPSKKPPRPPPAHPLVTPTAGRSGLPLTQLRTGAGSLFTPPLAASMRTAGPGSAPGPAELLWPPEGDASRLAAQPEQQPLPYTQRVHVTGALSYGSRTLPPTAGTADASSGDGMENLTHQTARLRFGRDLRLLEVRNLLRSSAPVVLRLGAAPEPTDAEGAQVQQIKLTTLAVRTMALPIGRGALMLGTLHPLPTEPLHIPMLCMSGRLPEQNNAIVNLDLSAVPPAPGGGAFCEYTAWPEFHNGVAAGLRLAPSGHQLTRTWIVYNKPEEPSYTHAGLLMALGLTGHLSCLAATDLYRYLSQEHDATIIGVLLGMAAAKRGALDSATSRMLFLHLPTRHPSTYPELEISPLVQAAALLGVGLLFQGSCHRLMAEVMLEEIGRRPGPASKQAEGSTGANLHQGVSQEREGYALAAGMALGLITLGRGRSALGLADLHLEERLRYLMLGGSDSGTVASQRGLAAVVGQGAAPEGVFGPGIIGFDPTLGEPQPRFASPARDSSSGRSGGTVADELAAAQGSSQVVLEGELVNLDVTSPAATLALGLMYLKTNDQDIASLFALPETHFALDFVRPEHLQLRVLMRALVLWDSVAPTEDWVQAQLPAILKGPLSKLMRGQVGADGGAAPAGVDLEAVAQAHCQALAGACLAVGIRYAGSCSAPAQALLRKYLLHFVRAKQGVAEPGAGAPAPVGRDVLEGCVGVVALALAVVMAGSGHLGTFKLLRGLRKRIAAASAAAAAHPSLAAPPATSYTYGAHMAVSAALGLLFMGAGALTLATSPQAVAALVISLYPRFPTSTTDNRCHLQAFRHLYVLASQPRSVDAVDVDTHQPVYVPLEIGLAAAAGGAGGGPPAAAASELRPVVSVSKGAGDVLSQYAAAGELGVGNGASVTFERVAPCLLPERDQVGVVRVRGPRYWPQALVSAGRDGSLDALYKTQTLFVQRKAGALPYAHDPSGVRSLLSHMFFRGGGAGEGGLDLVNLCATFGSDPFITSFAQVFCNEAGGSASGSNYASQLPIAAKGLLDFCRGALYECITREKPAALLPYLTLWCTMKGLSGASGFPDLAAGLPPAVPLWSLKLCRAYYSGSLGLAAETLLAATSSSSTSAEAAKEQWEPIVSPVFLQLCWRQLEQAWKAVVGTEVESRAAGSALRRYLLTQEVGGAEGGMLGAYLQLCKVPPVHHLRVVLGRIERALQDLQLGDGKAARGAAAALLAATFRSIPTDAVEAIVAAAAVAKGA